MHIDAPFPWQISQWDRLANQLNGNRLAHAYLLTGERLLGKKAFALAAAGLLLCERPQQGQACGQCRNCQLFAAGTNPDLLHIAPEGSKVIKVDQIRELNNFTSRTSHGASRQVIIIEQVDSLNINAANALLKTLEEPPGATVLLLVTDNPGKLLPTLRSRCQRLLFTIPESRLALTWLKQTADDKQDWEQLLAMADGKPIGAKVLAEADQQELRNTVYQGLQAVLAGQLDPVEFAAGVRSVGAEPVMEILWQSTVRLIRSLLTGPETAVLDEQNRNLQVVLSKSPHSADELLTRLMSVNTAAEEARRQLGSGSNPNPQLLLEGVVWRWSRVAF